MFEGSSITLKVVGPITLGSAREECRTLAEVSVKPSGQYWLGNDTTGQARDACLQGGRALFSLSASDFSGARMFSMQLTL